MDFKKIKKYKYDNCRNFLNCVTFFVKKTIKNTNPYYNNKFSAAYKLKKLAKKRKKFFRKVL